MQVRKQFWLYVDKQEPTSCWLWKGAVNSSGYGHLYYRTKHWYAHRLVLRWKLKRKIMPKHQALHTCDTRLCCNPLHIIEGTNLDSVRDMWRKGRQRDTKLTVGQIQNIRDAYIKGANYTDLASKYGVGKIYISLILRNKVWYDEEYEALKADIRTTEGYMSIHVDDMLLYYDMALKNLLDALSLEFKIPVEHIKRHIRKYRPKGIRSYK